MDGVNLFPVVHDGFRPAVDRFDLLLRNKVGFFGRILAIGCARQDTQGILRALFDALTAQDAVAIGVIILVHSEIAVSLGFAGVNALAAMDALINSYGQSLGLGVFIQGFSAVLLGFGRTGIDARPIATLLADNSHKDGRLIGVNFDAGLKGIDLPVVFPGTGHLADPAAYAFAGIMGNSSGNNILTPN